MISRPDELRARSLVEPERFWAEAAQAIDDLLARRLLLQEDAPAALRKMLDSGRATGAFAPPRQ